MSNCKDCKWWGNHLVGENNTKANKQRALCDNPDSPGCYEFYVRNMGKDGWKMIVDFWTYEDFGCKYFKEKEKQ